MSASPIFSSAATSRPFIFPLPPSPRWPKKPADEGERKPATKADAILAAVGAAPMLARVVPASRLEIRPAPEMVSSGIAQLDSLTGGLPRGCLTEICGPASSGRTSILLSALAQATRRGEVCALIDASDAFHPASAAAAGVEMGRLLWVRCGEKYSSRFAEVDVDERRSPQALKRNPSSTTYGTTERRALPNPSLALPTASRALIPHAAKNRRGFRRWKSQLEQMLKVTDLLLQSNGFGMIALDLGDVPSASARRIPLASWFRFRRAVEHTPTSLLVLEQQPIAGSCSSMLLQVSAARAEPRNVEPGNAEPANRKARAKLPHAELLDQFVITAQLLCSRLERQSQRKPMQSTTSFRSRAAWAG
jgi:hypothetical protein